MKKLLLKKFVAGLIILCGCKNKTNPAWQNLADKYKFTISRGMLNFRSSADYQRMATAITKGEEKTLAESAFDNSNFTSLSENYINDSIEIKKIGEDFLCAILNENKCIQIGKYIYKLNFKEEVIYVIPENKIELQKVSNDSLSHMELIRIYKMEEDVINLAETNIASPSARLFCNESGAGHDRKSSAVNLAKPGTNNFCGTLTAEVKYGTFGIWFNLKCFATNICTNDRIIYIHETPVAYKVKCGPTKSPAYQWDINPSSSNGYYVGTYYKGVKPLNAFWFRIVFMAKDKNWIGNPDNPSIDLEIRKNM